MFFAALSGGFRRRTSSFISTPLPSLGGGCDAISVIGWCYPADVYPFFSGVSNDKPDVVQVLRCGASLRPFGFRLRVFIFDMVNFCYGAFTPQEIESWHGARRDLYCLPCIIYGLADFSLQS